jgi:hypothetical protein
MPFSTKPLPTEEPGRNPLAGNTLQDAGTRNKRCFVAQQAAYVRFCRLRTIWCVPVTRSCPLGNSGGGSGRLSNADAGIMGRRRRWEPVDGCSSPGLYQRPQPHNRHNRPRCLSIGNELPVYSQTAAHRWSRVSGPSLLVGGSPEPADAPEISWSAPLLPLSRCWSRRS